jgi:hypothetical protein
MPMVAGAAPVDPRYYDPAYGAPAYAGRMPGQYGKVGIPGGHHYRPPTDPRGYAPQYAYPYYTIRGPRDFLVDNPPSIGPY